MSLPIKPLNTKFGPSNTDILVMCRSNRWLTTPPTGISLVPTLLTVLIPGSDKNPR